MVNLNINILLTKSIEAIKDLPKQKQNLIIKNRNEFLFQNCVELDYPLQKLKNKRISKLIDSAWFLVKYIPKYQDITALSKMILQFKEGKKEIVDYWVNTAKKALKDEKFDYILRPLSSQETDKLIEQPLDLLGKALSKNGNFIPYFFKKKEKHIPLHLLKNEEERYETLKRIYQLNNYKIDLNEKRILIIDDIISSGSTMKILSEILKEKYPKIEIYCFILAETSHTILINKFMIMKSIRANINKTLF